LCVIIITDTLHVQIIMRAYKGSFGTSSMGWVTTIVTHFSFLGSEWCDREGRLAHGPAQHLASTIVIYPCNL